MARIFFGVTLSALVALCIACGGAGSPPITTSTSHTPPDSAAVDRPETEASRAERREDQYLPVIIDWIEQGEPDLVFTDGGTGRVPSLELVRIVDESTSICFYGDTAQLVWVDGVNTSGRVDGQRFSLDLAQIRGTVQLDNGSTMFRLVPMSSEAAREAIAQRANERAEFEAMQKAERLAEAERQADADREAQFRKWMSADQQFTIEARLDRFAAGIAYLERRDGITVEVPAELLSDDDQLYIEEEFQRRGKAKRAIDRTREGA